MDQGELGVPVVEVVLEGLEVAERLLEAACKVCLALRKGGLRCERCQRRGYNEGRFHEPGPKRSRYKA